MLMKVNTATMPIPMRCSLGRAEPPLVLHVVERQGHVHGGVDVRESVHHQPAWKLQYSPMPRRIQR